MSWLVVVVVIAVVAAAVVAAAVVVVVVVVVAAAVVVVVDPSVIPYTMYMYHILLNKRPGVYFLKWWLDQINVKKKRKNKEIRSSTGFEPEIFHFPVAYANRLSCFYHSQPLQNK